MKKDKNGIRIHIHPKGEFDDISSSEKLRVSELLTHFLETYKKISQEFDVNLELKRHKEKIMSISQYYCHLTVTMDSGKFHAEAKGIGVHQAIRNCTDQVSKQISKKIEKKREQHHVITRDKDPFKMS